MRYCGQARQATEAGQQLEHSRGLDLRPQDPFQPWADLGQQAADAVADRGDLASQIGQGLVAGVEPAQGVWHRPGCLGGDVGIGLGCRVQVCDPAHHEPGQVGRIDAQFPNDRDRERAPMDAGWSTTTSTRPR